MSESLWWPDETWWERRILPLGFITLSFRQLATIVCIFLIAFATSLPFQFPIAGISFGGRAAVFGIVFSVGYMISNRRVRLLSVELQAIYLDPFTIFPSKRVAANFLASVAKVENDPDLLADLYLTAET